MLTLALASALQVATAAPQTVRLEVATAAVDPRLVVRVDAVWLGEARSVTLRDDGAATGDVAGDGVWLGELRGEAVSMLPLTITVERGSSSGVVAWEGSEPIALGEDHLSWALELGDTPRAYRVAATATSREARGREAAAVTAPIAWACFVLIYAAWLVERALREDAP